MPKMKCKNSSSKKRKLMTPLKEQLASQHKDGRRTSSLTSRTCRTMTHRKSWTSQRTSPLTFDEIVHSMTMRMNHLPLKRMVLTTDQCLCQRDNPQSDIQSCLINSHPEGQTWMISNRSRFREALRLIVRRRRRVLIAGKIFHRLGLLKLSIRNINNDY